MIKTIIFFTLFGLSLFVSLLFYLVYLLLRVLHIEGAAQRILELATGGWASFMIKASGSKVEVVGRENIPQGPVLFVANHQSYFDIPVFMVYAPKFVAFIAKVELEKIPVLSWWMKKMGCLFMDRKDLRQSLKIILEGIESLKAGRTMVIFPEGTRGKNGEMSDFKPGSLKLAVKAGVPIVPVTLKDTYKVFEANNRIRKSKITMYFHEPIDVTALSRDEVTSLHITVHDIIKSTLER